MLDASPNRFASTGKPESECLSSGSLSPSGAGFRGGAGAFLCSTALYLVLAGCSTLHLPGSSAPAPKPTVQNPYAPKAPEEHFWSSWFKPKEPEKPKSVKEWMSTTKQIPLESAATKQ
jgi:hypothetical protein